MFNDVYSDVRIVVKNQLARVASIAYYTYKYNLQLYS